MSRNDSLKSEYIYQHYGHILAYAYNHLFPRCVVRTISGSHSKCTHPAHFSVGQLIILATEKERRNDLIELGLYYFQVQL